MLAPQSRRYLLDALRPDPDYMLDTAVGTTFSLDLLTLLTTPMAFSLLGWTADEVSQTPNPVALLESVRRYAERITIFCQAGRIKVPVQHRLLYAYLENSVFEVAAQHETRSFHPKVWVLRYRSRTPDTAPRYRLLCLSRNLTFDRCWDTALVLDGTIVQGPVATNEPLCRFLATLPNLAIHQPTAHVSERVVRLAEELRSVRFELPEGISDLSFYPLGTDDADPWPFSEPLQRICVVSPFLEPNTLRRLTARGRDHVLISRLAALQALTPVDLAGFARIYAMSDAAQVEPEDSGVTDEISKSVTDANHSELLGLHAKLYIGESDRHTYIWTGSANATHAAYDGNVEFLVRLQGQKERYGIDAFLGIADSDGSMLRLLDEFVPNTTAVVDPVQKTLDDLLNLTSSILFQMKLQAEVSPRDGVYPYSITLRSGTEARLPNGVEVLCWPITLAEPFAVCLPPVAAPGAAVALFNVSFEALTTFFAFRLRAEESGPHTETSFVLNLPTTGMPEHRESLLLQAMLRDSQQVMQLILLLLADYDDGTAMGWLTKAIAEGQDMSNGWQRTVPPLFETMVRALGRDPSRLDAVASLIAELRKTPEAIKLLPEGFDEIWTPIWKVRNSLTQGSPHGTH